jgi:uncharacterized cupredoxin-like copper-binding protein
MSRRALVAIVAAGATAVLALGQAGAASRAQTVPVTLKEFKIVLPATLKPGPTTFVLKNTGKFDHDMVVAYHAQGSAFHSPTVKPGQTVRFSTTLRPGAYVVVCMMNNGFHAAQGMIARFSVGSFDFKTGKWHA